MSGDIEHWIRPEIRALSAYHVPDATGLIKLDAMENPYPLPESLIEPWLATLREVALNRYPSAEAGAVKRSLAEAMSVPAGQAIVLGNGSDELIQMLALALGAPGRCLMAPEPGFVMYRMIAGFTGMTYHGVPLREADFALDLEALLAAIEAHEPAILFLAYPNNPTGNLWDRAAMETLIQRAPGLVVIDEAYAPFAADSFMGDLGRFDNLLVMRTVSKMGLAGLRLGALCGPPAWLDELEKVRLPYNINALTQASAVFAFEHREVFERQAARIREERGRLHTALAAIEGIEPYPSEANFILFRTPAGRAGALYEALRQGGVLIKNLAGAGGMLGDCLRVTVGTPEENRRFIEVLQAAVGG